MFKKAVYKYSSYCGTIRDKEKVLSDFQDDIKNCKPICIKRNKTRIYVSFKDPKYLINYELPLSYDYLLTRKAGE